MTTASETCNEVNETLLEATSSPYPRAKSVLTALRAHTGKLQRLVDSHLTRNGVSLHVIISASLTHGPQEIWISLWSVRVLSACSCRYAHVLNWRISLTLWNFSFSTKGSILVLITVASSDSLKSCVWVFDVARAFVAIFKPSTSIRSTQPFVRRLRMTDTV
jgi:hypothetical protein